MKGNQKAQELLYYKYKIIVENYLRSKYSKSYDIDDDVSEIMIRVIMNLSTFDINKSKFKSWVFSITKNHMIDKWRNNTITLTGSNTNCTYSYSTTGEFTLNSNYNTTTSNSGIFNESSLITTSYCSADYEVENCSSINYVSTQLTPQDYTLLDMKYVQGYNYNEIGTEFNLTSSTVSNRVNYIKTKLKKDNPEIIYE
ncbi:MAG: sigma-70 family RNA polymerase sigma factor [Bacteroidales bacterium]|nr:sigma-70 family RNA polymerase sigma factor [Bacteroidales bacterium]